MIWYISYVVICNIDNFICNRSHKKYNILKKYSSSEFKIDSIYKLEKYHYIIVIKSWMKNHLNNIPKITKIAFLVIIANNNDVSL